MFISGFGSTNQHFQFFWYLGFVFGYFANLLQILNNIIKIQNIMGMDLSIDYKN